MCAVQVLNVSKWDAAVNVMWSTRIHVAENSLFRHRCLGSDDVVLFASLFSLLSPADFPRVHESYCPALKVPKWKYFRSIHIYCIFVNVSPEYINRYELIFFSHITKAYAVFSHFTTIANSSLKHTYRSKSHIIRKWRSTHTHKKTYYLQLQTNIYSQQQNTITL